MLVGGPVLAGPLSAYTLLDRPGGYFGTTPLSLTTKHDLACNRSHTRRIFSEIGSDDENDARADTPSPRFHTIIVVGRFKIHRVNRNSAGTNEMTVIGKFTVVVSSVTHRIHYIR
ncbi:hypothetical protein AVEN_119993-1 [Araneus ventricosus]|uniref:Uncharacterized protein n=1 Tax=Araneus ventricosus TaxID=182803 RepID=A0A4Y2U872_ARAVE|nr:hypothetical protein AVEN_49805-1 [Araneus ventricosus]GBO08693.1 hypothetical protein AVEN_187688-1 [Araneus ventricosus]GBO09064.1 hypothetical protein AVEN_170414-1 [Araneus ventricosus]GBO09244.1 hypothetical protein AVEN_119993-1 [Araneus ventricosus]